MRRKKFLVAIAILIILFGLGFTGGYVLYQYRLQEQEKVETDALLKARSAYAKLFVDQKQTTVKLEVSQTEVDNVKKLFAEVKREASKKKYLKTLNYIDLFIKARDQIRYFIVDGVMKSTTTDEDIAKLQALFQRLKPSDQTLLNDTFNLVINQRNNIKEIESILACFFENDKVKDEIDVGAFTDLKNRLDVLPQKDIVEKYSEKVKQIHSHIETLEQKRRAELEAERQAAIARAQAESERLKRENEAIMASNVILGGVPRINQKNGVLNGCEVASLLMGLQYKGYNQGMSLREIAEAVPKSDNPHTGFVLDIWGSLPLDRAHWIAPDALTTFGKTYYNGVTDISGASVDDLKREIDNGHPVIVYGTYGFYNPRGWDGEVPVNLHVMLMIGYNKMTGNIIIHDPWGGIEMVVNGNAFANQYNLMNYAVSIR